MALETTWNLLINDFTPPAFITAIEQRLTGSRFIYGLDTIIAISDLLDRVGVDTAIYALSHATTDTTAIQVAAGFDMVDAWLSIWYAFRPTDHSITNLLIHAQQLYAAQGGSGPINLNSCGDPVSFVSGITADFVNGEAATLQSFLDTLSLVKNAPGQFTTMLVDPNDPYTPFLTAPDGTHNLRFIYDPQFIPVPTTLPGYVTHPLKEPDPVSGLPVFRYDLISAEDQDFIAYAQRHPGNVTPFATVQNNPGFNAGLINDDANIALNYIGGAAIRAAQAVSIGIPLLSSLAQYVEQSVIHYAFDQRQKIIDIQNALLQVTGGSIPIDALNDYPNNSYAAQLLAQRNAIKLTIIQDYAFWAAFDTDFSGGLSMTERYNAEIGFNAAVLAQVEEASLALYNTTRVTLNTLINTTSGIELILRPYLL